jgi:hypothetical protein
MDQRDTDKRDAHQRDMHQRELGMQAQARHVPGTIVVRSIAGRAAFRPGEGKTVRFGRSDGQAQVCVGIDDTQVSREQGTLTWRQGRWWVTNLGPSPMRLPGPRMLFAGEDALPLEDGFTQMYVCGTPGREHLLEVYVVGDEHRSPVPRPDDATRPPRPWYLNKRERLALTVLGQRYLRHESHPQPLTWRDTLKELAELEPAAGWTDAQLRHLVEDVRGRLSRDGVSGLTEEEVGRPVGNALNDNLLRALLTSTSLLPADLAPLDARESALD